MKVLVCSLLLVSKLVALTIILPMRDKLPQQEEPVHWAYSAKKLDQNKYEIHLTASMNVGWHIYAQEQPKEAIAIPTKIKISLNPLIAMIGKVIEIGKREKHEIKEVGIVQYEYQDTVDFVQVISVKANIKTNISGIVSFQACTDKKCLPVKAVSFNISVNSHEYTASFQNIPIPDV